MIKALKRFIGVTRRRAPSAELVRWRRTGAPHRALGRSGARALGCSGARALGRSGPGTGPGPGPGPVQGPATPTPQVLIGGLAVTRFQLELLAPLFGSRAADPRQARSVEWQRSWHMKSTTHRLMTPLRRRSRISCRLRSSPRRTPRGPRTGKGGASQAKGSSARRSP
jgi:hypothetical protein